MLILCLKIRQTDYYEFVHPALLKQSPATIEVVKETFNLSDEENIYCLNAMWAKVYFCRIKTHAIKVIASYTEDQIITSNPEQILAIQKRRKRWNKSRKFVK